VPGTNGSFLAFFADFFAHSAVQDFSDGCGKVKPFTAKDAKQIRKGRKEGLPPNGTLSSLPTCRRCAEARQCSRSSNEGDALKYRQHGYQDRGEETRKKELTERPVKKDTFGPRPIQMPGTRAVSRCSQCGSLLQSLSDPVGQCPKCGFELHSCKQCTYFDPSSRFECTQPIPERIPRKDQRNECAFYSIRVMVEKETSTPASLRPNDARQAFENLFKK
jgi:hypothetical protein